MKNLLLTLLFGILLINPAFGEDKGVAPPIESATSAPVVDGLELPPDQKVNYDEGFVNIAAKCSGQVKWLVVSGVKVKYVTIAQTNNIIVSVPTTSATISIFAVAEVNGKLTDFARTNIIVSGSMPAPSPLPPNNNVTPTVSRLHVTFLIDMNTVTTDVATLMNSATLRQAITGGGSYFRLYDINSPVVAQKKLTKFVQQVGGTNIMIVQDDSGKVLNSQVIPKTEQDIINVVTNLAK